MLGMTNATHKVPLMNRIFIPKEPNLVIFKIVSDQIPKQEVPKIAPGPGLGADSTKRDAASVFKRLLILNFVVYF